jgi:hypothetical protein
LYSKTQLNGPITLKKHLRINPGKTICTSVQDQNSSSGQGHNSCDANSSSIYHGQDNNNHRNNEHHHNLKQY